MNFNEDVALSSRQTVEVVGFGRRLAAYLIDNIIVAMVTGCLGFGIGLATINGDPDVASIASLAVNCMSILLTAAYFIVFWGATGGQTPGKMAMGIKIISADGSPITWGKAVVRYIGYILSGIVIGIGFLWVSFDVQRQGWHDKIANTLVVRKDVYFSDADSVAFVPSDPGQSWIWGVLFVALLILPICLIAVLLLTGPIIGDVFSGIISGLE